MTLKRDSKRPLAISGAACFAVVVGALSVSSLRSSDSNTAQFVTAPVSRGMFVRTIPAVGDVRSYRPVTFYSDCRAKPRKIIELVPEGTWVEKGDVVCVLDSSEFRDKLNEPTIDLIRARAAVDIAEAAEALQESMNARNLALSEMDAEIARDRFRAFQEAEADVELVRLLGNVVTKRENLDQSRHELDHTRRTANLGITNLSSLDRSRTRWQRSRRELQLALGEVSLTERFKHPRSQTELRAMAANAQGEVNRTHLRNQLAITMARHDTLSKHSWVAGWERYVDYLTRSIDACTMRAPKSGEVAYVNDPGSGRIIEIGREVHYVQKVFRITDRSKLTVAGRVSDRYFNDLHEGQPAEVEFDRLPGRRFNARLNWVGQLPSAIDRWTPYILHHKVEILFDEDAESLAVLFPGMSADVKIIVDSRRNVLQVPADAVIEHNDQYLVIVHESGRLSVRPVEIGASNRFNVEVIGGLEQDAHVVLDNPHALRELADSLL